MEHMEELKSVSRFRGQVLNKVYRIWLFRKFLPVFLAEIIVLSLLFYKISRAVFVQKILENAVGILFQNPAAIFKFIFSAFENANNLIKALAILSAVLIALLVRLLTQGFLRYLLVKKNYFGRTEA